MRAVIEVTITGGGTLEDTDLTNLQEAFGAVNEHVEKLRTLGIFLDLQSTSRLDVAPAADANIFPPEPPLTLELADTLREVYAHLERRTRLGEEQDWIKANLGLFSSCSRRQKEGIVAFYLSGPPDRSRAAKSLNITKGRIGRLVVAAKDRARYALSRRLEEWLDTLSSEEFASLPAEAACLSGRVPKGVTTVADLFREGEAVRKIVYSEKVRWIAEQHGLTS